ncbi:phosphotransferase family protein [Nonomuraea sp. NPDC004702]
MGALPRHPHALPNPPGGTLPAFDPFDPFDPFERRKAHIGQATGLHERDRRLPRELVERSRTAYARLPFAGAPRAIHGDPHRKNLIRARGHGTVTLDLERFSIGPVEWDLVVVANYHLVGWYTAKEYASFAHAYGVDVMRWEGLAELARPRRPRMTTWLASRTGREPHLIPEVHLRISTSRDLSTARAWTPGT